MLHICIFANMRVTNCSSFMFWIADTKAVYNQCVSALRRPLLKVFHGPDLKLIINTIVKSWHLGDNFSLKKDHSLN